MSIEVNQVKKIQNMLKFLLFFALLGGLGYLYFIKQSVEETKTLISSTHSIIDDGLWCFDAVFTIFCNREITGATDEFVGIGPYVLRSEHTMYILSFAYLFVILAIYYVIKELFLPNSIKDKLDSRERHWESLWEKWGKTIKFIFYGLLFLFLLGVYFFL